MHLAWTNGVDSEVADGYPFGPRFPSNHLPELSSILKLASGGPTKPIYQTPTHVNKQPVVDLKVLGTIH